MKNVIITDASGMAGSLILKECLNCNSIAKVTSLVRKPSGIVHEKLTEVLITDFALLYDYSEYFKNQNTAYFCIGVYTGAVPRDEFRKITVDYTIAFADLLKTESPDSIFCFLSGMGADQTERSSIMFAKYKGAAENYLISKQFNGLYIFRPAYIYPVSTRKEPNITYKIMRFVYPLIKLISPKSVITSEYLAKAMFVTGLSGGMQTVLENPDILKINIS